MTGGPKRGWREGYFMDNSIVQYIYIYIWKDQLGPTYTVPSIEYGLWHESMSFSSSFSAFEVFSLSQVKLLDVSILRITYSIPPLCMYVCMCVFIYLFFKNLVWSFHMWHWGCPINFIWVYFLTYISKNELRIPFLKGITPSWDDAQVRYCQSKKLVALFAQ